jgi:hypothetical protein
MFTLWDSLEAVRDPTATHYEVDTEVATGSG